jgi:hypothetical protein
MSLGEVGFIVSIIPLGGGAGTTDGTSPAKAKPERIKLRVIAITSRFIEVSPLGLRMQDFLHQGRIEQHLENVARLPEGN